MSTIVIDVKTHYLAAQSDPDNGQYVFAYTITITNQGEASVQLLNRAWRITDADHKITRVAGDGVVGEQPVCGSYLPRIALAQSRLDSGRNGIGMGRPTRYRFDLSLKWTGASILARKLGSKCGPL